MTEIPDKVAKNLPNVLPFQIDSGWVVTIHEGGLIRTKHMTNLPSPERQIYAIELCQRLNREISFGGKWVVAWSDWGECGSFSNDDYRRLTLIFLDRDGDPQFTVEIEDLFVVMVSAAEDYLEQAAQAWKQHLEFKRDVDARSEDQIKAALGQESADPEAPGPLLDNLE